MHHVVQNIFFTGKYNGDDSSEEITAIGFGGEIYARGVMMKSLLVLLRQ
ncbi:hypothetical protein [Yersinia vastinensis]|nr:hypothetical protein [Yersinia vastinensis]